MSFELEGGICIKLATCPDDDEIFEMPHTVQVLSSKLIVQPGSNIERYRIILSDGETLLQAMLATQLNDMMTENRIPKHSVVVLEKTTGNVVKGKRYATRYGR